MTLNDLASRPIHWSSTPEMGCEESSKGLATADLLELIEKANEEFKRGARVDYVNVIEELLVKVKD